MPAKNLFIVGILATCVGCESEIDESMYVDLEPSEGNASEWFTQDGVQAETYRAGLSKSFGDEGGLVVLVESDPVVEFSGKYAWNLQLEGTGSLDVDRVEARATMPDHGHGTIPGMVESGVSDGAALLSPLNFYMGGIWKVELLLFSGDTQVGAQAFHFYVEG